MITRMEFNEIFLRVAKRNNIEPPSPEMADYLWEQDSPHFGEITVQQLEEMVEKQISKGIKELDAPVTRKDHDEILIRYGKLTDSIPTTERLDKAWEALQKLPPLTLKEFEIKFFKAWYSTMEPIVQKQIQDGTAPQWFIDAIPPGHFPVENKPKPGSPWN